MRVAVDDPADPRLADYLDLRGGRPTGTGPVIVEGWIAVEELLVSPLIVRSILVTRRKADRLPPVAESTPVYVADEAVLRATVGFDLHRGVVASADRPPAEDPATILRGARRVVACERVNDLENLGAIFRNGRAFGVDAILLDPETADPLGRRPVRVSLGHALRVPFARLDPWPDALATLAATAGLTVVALTPTGDASLDDLPDRAVFVVGAEGPGLAAATIERADRRLRIPMSEGVDSLNVATAAAIALSAHFGQHRCR